MNTNETITYFGAPVAYTLYQVAEERIEVLRKRLDSLSRRAAKLGVGSISYEVGPVFTAAYIRGQEIWLRWDWLRNPAVLADQPKRFRQFRFVKLTATTPRCEGWAFVATLQHLWDDEAKQGINLLRCAPGFRGELPLRFRNADASNCDHCHKQIMTRKDTFVVHNPELNEWKQVGRSCLCDFLGGHDPHGVARMLEYGLEASAACGEDEEDKDPFSAGGSHKFDGVGISEFLAQTAACCRLEGWLSRSKARLDDCGPRATADLVNYLLDEPLSRDAKVIAEWRADCIKYAPQPMDIELAGKALDYARERLGDKGEARSDFEHNLYVAIVQPIVTQRTAGISAYLIPYYLKEVEQITLKEAEAHLVADSTHFGEVGKRCDLYVKLLKVIQIEGRYGTTYLHKLLTREGNLAIWFASSCPGLEQGVEYRLSAGIKKHDTRNGTAQTVLTRCTVYTELGRAQAEEKEAKRAEREAKKAARAKPTPSAPPETAEAPKSMEPSEAQKTAGERYAERRFQRHHKLLRDNYVC
jgi:hypothetical protein